MKLDLTLPLPKLKTLYVKAKEAYYEDSNPILTDAQFDKLEDFIKQEDPNWKGFKVGAPVKNKKAKVKLTIPMFSLDKVKAPTVQKWLDKQDSNSYVTVSDKLDGSSLELEYREGKPFSCVTRGNGVIGGDVSFLIPHLKIPQKVGTADFILRCEGLFSKAGFLKYKAEFDAARNAASGILNRQDAHHSLKDLKIVVLQVLRPNLVPSKALTWAKQKGFLVVPWSRVKVSQLNARNLSVLLEKRKVSSKYQIDGIVITLDKVNKLPLTGNPDFAVAFKSNIDSESAPVTTVRDVEWEVSAHGLLKPVVVYDAVDWEGSKLTRATAFNAAFVNENGIGKGAKIAILRSGDVIPYIAKVVKKVKPSVPSVDTFGDYALNKRGTDYVLTSPLDNEDFRIKKISRFFVNIGVDFLRERTVRKLYASGFTNVKSITTATPKEFLKVPGVKATTANKIHQNIHKVLDSGIDTVTLMDASGVFPFGMGTTRLENIQSKYNLLDLCAAPESEQMKVLVNISGFNTVTAQMFVKGSKKFLKWMKLVGITPVQRKKEKVKLESNKLDGTRVAWTGYRDKAQEDIVTKNGGKVESFGARTQILLVSPTGKASSKVDKANAKGIPVLTWDKFARKYRL